MYTWLMVLTLTQFQLADSLETNDIVIVILSQASPYHASLAQNKKNDINFQADQLKMPRPIVHQTHKDLTHVGDWTILPLLSSLSDLHAVNTSLILFIEERTKLNLNELLKTLDKYDWNKEIWLGHALCDREATIIHHFAFYQNPQFFHYPNAGSGVVLSMKLVRKLTKLLNTIPPSTTDFSIDSWHELALYIWNGGKGPNLVNVTSFCAFQQEGCATYPERFDGCTNDVPSIYFAVKTCTKFHRDRVAVVKKTWAKHVDAISYFSDVYDEEIPTVLVDIPNTDTGHCVKTLQILDHIQKLMEKKPGLEWLILVDDDTILSVARIQKLLTCYNFSTPIALGERYGYGVHDPNGYNYITGGGGIILSRTLIKLLTQKGVCECPSLTTPDDMFLGLCIKRLGLNVIHSPLFHQARPIDYASGYLATNDAISFHKHWMVDALQIYSEWFEMDDDKLKIHDEF